MISKKLLSDVLGVKIVSMRIVNTSMLAYRCETEPKGIINIHELSHKCKEWAYESGCTCFMSGQSDNGEKCEFYWGFDEHCFNANTETEAIFKACQWILDNKEKQ